MQCFAACTHLNLRRHSTDPQTGQVLRAALTLRMISPCECVYKDTDATNEFVYRPLNGFCVCQSNSGTSETIALKLVLLSLVWRCPFVFPDKDGLGSRCLENPWIFNLLFVSMSSVENPARMCLCLLTYGPFGQAFASPCQRP